MIFGFLSKTPNFQNVTNPKVPNQFSNLKMLLIPKTQMVNLSHWKLQNVQWLAHSRVAKNMDSSGRLHKTHEYPGFQISMAEVQCKEGKKRDLQKGPEGSLLVRVITSIRAYFVDPLHLRSIVYAATVWNKRFLGKPIKCQTN